MNVPDDVSLNHADGTPMSLADIEKERARIALLVEGEQKNWKLKNGICEVDQRPIKMLTYQGTGVCCELCRKRRDDEISQETYEALRAALTPSSLRSLPTPVNFP